MKLQSSVLHCFTEAYSSVYENNGIVEIWIRQLIREPQIVIHVIAMTRCRVTRILELLYSNVASAFSSLIEMIPL